jgi:hypothetical protein
VGRLTAPRSEAPRLARAAESYGTEPRGVKARSPALRWRRVEWPTPAAWLRVPLRWEIAAGSRRHGEILNICCQGSNKRSRLRRAHRSRRGRWRGRHFGRRRVLVICRCLAGRCCHRAPRPTQPAPSRRPRAGRRAPSGPRPRPGPRHPALLARRRPPASEACVGVSHHRLALCIPKPSHITACRPGNGTLIKRAKRRVDWRARPGPRVRRGIPLYDPGPPPGSRQRAAQSRRPRPEARQARLLVWARPSSAGPRSGLARRSGAAACQGHRPEAGPRPVRARPLESATWRPIWPGLGLGAG